MFSYIKQCSGLLLVNVIRRNDLAWALELQVLNSTTDEILCGNIIIITQQEIQHAASAIYVYIVNGHLWLIVFVSKCKVNDKTNSPSSFPE